MLATPKTPRTGRGPAEDRKVRGEGTSDWRTGQGRAQGRREAGSKEGADEREGEEEDARERGAAVNGAEGRGKRRWKGILKGRQRG